MNSDLQPQDHVIALTEIDIVISVYNQELLIERVLEGLCKSLRTPFTLILIFDGCTDASRDRALAYIGSTNLAHMKELIEVTTPNLYETRANNVGFKLARSAYLITIQDDMVIDEPGFEIRLTYPLRAFTNVLAVSARIAQDIVHISPREQIYTRRAGREFGTLPRTQFSVRDVINRGPIAFDSEKLKRLGYLNDAYAPSVLDDADLCLRAWRDFRWLSGAFWINYISKPEWSKSKSADSTMEVGGSNIQNAVQLSKDHAEYLLHPCSHSQDICIPDTEIDYPKEFDRTSLAAIIRKSNIYFFYDLTLRRAGRAARRARQILISIFRRVLRTM